MKRTKHEIVKQNIIHWIATGTLETGQRVPTEEELAASFSVSKSPVRQALAELAAEGYIYTLHGSGSYVCERDAAAAFVIHAFMYTGANIERGIVLGMHGAVRHRRDPGLRLSFQHPGDSTEELIHHVTALRFDVPGALVLIPVSTPNRQVSRHLATALRRLVSDGWTVVQVDQIVPGFDAPVVMSDHREAARMLCSHLIDLGHRRIAVLLDHQERSSIRLRLDGAREALEDPLVVRCRDEATDDEWDTVIAELGEAGVTAVCAFESELSDRLATHLKRRGHSIPGSMSLCTFDESPGTDLSMTHIQQPLFSIGVRAIDVALELSGLSQTRSSSTVHALPAKLVVGASTAEVL